jgi:hypothetical protein
MMNDDVLFLKPDDGDQHWQKFIVAVWPAAQERMQAVLAQHLITQTGLEQSVLRSSVAGQVGTCPVRTLASTQIEFRTCGRRMVAAAAARPLFPSPSMLQTNAE